MGIDANGIRGPREPVLDYRGTLYCWPCAMEMEVPISKGFRVTGERPGHEPCSVCHRVGSLVLKVDALDG